MRRAVIASSSGVLAVLALSACGGSSATSGTSDQSNITQIIKAYGKEPTKLCTTYATAHMIQRQFGSTATCIKLASSPTARDPNVQVDSVAVKGNQAVAIRTSEANPGKGTKAALHFVKTSSGWKIDSITPA
jgi:hypothetical protein